MHTDDGDKLLDYSKNLEYRPFEFFEKDKIDFIDEQKIIQEKSPKNTKRKKSAWKIIFDFLKVFIVIGIILTMAYTLISGSAMRMEEDSFKIKIGNYGKNPVWMPYGNSQEVNNIYSNLSQNGKLQTAYEIYKLACERLNLSKEYSVRASGRVSLAFGETYASVISNREEHYFVLGEPSLNANQPVEYSNYDINYCTELHGNEALASILSAMAVFGVRAYCDGEKVYEQRSKSLEKNEDNQYIAIWSNDHKELDRDFERGYKDGELKEKTNFVINPSTILPDSVDIQRVNNNGVYSYNVSFKLDCSTSQLGSATYFEAEAIKRKMLDTKVFVYNYMEVNFSVYENGYLSYWSSKQKYTAEVIIFPLTATMNKQEYISYDPDECNVVNFLAV